MVSWGWRCAGRLGITGKLRILPRQVRVAEEALRPTDDEVRWAASVVEAAQTDGVVHEGQMVDKPVVDRARRILRTARCGRQRPVQLAGNCWPTWRPKSGRRG